MTASMRLPGSASAKTDWRSRLRIVAVAFVFALVATACSSSTATTTTASAGDEADTAAETSDAQAESESESESESAPAEAPTATVTPVPTEEPEPEPTDEPEDDAEQNESASSGFASDDDFCRVARDLDENDPFEDADLDPFSPDFFEVASELYDSLLAIAPDAIRSDIAVVRDELIGVGEQLAAVDYDFTDPAFGEIMESLDSGTIDDSAMRIEAYLSEACGIDVDDLDDLDDSIDDAEDALEAMPDLGLDEDALAALSQIGPDEAAMLLGQLVSDPELQACLLEKLPELTASQDPSILTEEICGTTLLEIVSGLSG